MGDCELVNATDTAQEMMYLEEEAERPSLARHALSKAIPSLWARDCSKNEKEALNYLFLLVPLINVIIPFFWKSFAVVWSTDTIAFFSMYAWKFGWLQRTD